ncbi:reverse transcriptase domain-containing protein [Tanacetum coccineum]
MTSPNKPTSKPSRVAKMSVKPIWRKKPNLCNTSNVLNTTSPIPKPLTPHHEPSQENNHPNQALPNPYIKDTPTSPQVMVSQGVKPNTVTYNIIIDAYRKAKRLSKLKTAIDAAGNHGKTIQTVERPGSVKAKFFTEGANHPTHPEADESDKIEKYVGGLPDMIHGKLTEYRKTLCSKVLTTHDSQCAQNAHKWQPELSPSALTVGVLQMSILLITKRGTRAGQKPTCYKCGAHGHVKRDRPKLKNNKPGTKSTECNASAKVYAVGRAGTNPDSNVVTGTFLLNNCYASILFNTGADRSFVSTTFSSKIDITPSTLDHYYDVELADGRIIGINAIIRDCTLNFLKHPFNIDLIPVELGSFDVIIGMDWLAKYQAVIVCAKKIICIP